MNETVMQAGVAGILILAFAMWGLPQLGVHHRTYADKDVPTGRSESTQQVEAKAKKETDSFVFVPTGGLMPLPTLGIEK